MKYFSLFSGVGGFEIGIHNAYDNSAIGTSTNRQINGEEYLPNTESWHEEWRQPATCIGFSEIDKYASAVLKYRFPNTTNYGDITKIDWSTIPDFDMLVGGSPCQSFSIAGKRAGFAGASGLFWEYLRCLKEKEPQYFIWENVKGCLSSNGGRDFATILTAFSEAGYSLTWQVLNAKDFGVPQNRERVFVIGARGEPEREVFFERCNDTKSLEYIGSASKRDWAGDGKDLSRNAPQGSRIYSENGIMPALAKETGGHGRVSGLVQLNNPKHSNYIVYSSEGISPTLNTMQGGMRQPFVQLTTKSEREYNGIYVKQNTGRYKEEMSSLSETTQEKMVSKEQTVGRQQDLPEENLLRLGMSKRNDASQVEEENIAMGRKLSGKTGIQQGRDMRDMSGEKENRDSSFGRGQNEQRLEQPSRDLSGLSHEATSDKCSEKCVEEAGTETKRDIRIRRLTPLEAERLMSWPDDWTKYGVFDGVVKEISDSQRYKMCGNGVVSKVIEHIIRECI